MSGFQFSIKDVMEIAERKVGIEGWSAYRWESVGEDSLVTGSIPDGTYRSGPRKGRPRRKGPGDRVVVAKPEMEATAAAFEDSTGRCWNCKGDGRVVTGFNKEGTTYQRCSRCSGTGDAP
jgi:hypothetical protein